MIASGIYGADVGRLPREGDGGWRWLLSIRYAGRVLRWGDGDLSAIELDGALYAVNLDSDLSGLSVTSAIPIGSVGVAPRSLSFSVYMPSGIDVALNERNSVRFAGCEVEVALVPDGGTLSDRCVVLRGFASEPTYGAADDPVSFTAREPEAYADAVYPPDPARTVVPLDLRGIQKDGVGPADVTWFEPSTIPRTDLESLVNVGQVWPRVFGKPGAVTLASGSTSPRPATPAYVLAQQYSPGYEAIEWEAMLVSFEHVNTQAGDHVALIRKDDTYDGGTIAISLPVYNGLDDRGVPFAYVKDTDVLAIFDPPKSGMDLHDLLQMTDWSVAWGAFDDSAAGPPINGTSDPSAADVLLWMVGRSSLTWDVGRCASASSALQSFKLAGAIEDTTRPLEWLSDHVFGRLPVYLASGPLGLYAAPVPYDPQHAAPVAALTVDDWSVVLPRQAVQVETDERAGTVAVNWCRDVTLGAYYKRAFRVAGDPDPRSAGDAPWYASTLPSDGTTNGTVSFDLPYVWDDQTAYRVLDWLAWREMKQRRTIAIDVDPSTFGRLMVGDVVTFTADALHLEAAKCMVASVTWSTAPWWRLKLMPLDD